MSSNCQFWMSNDAGAEAFQFPVLPEKITYTHDSDNDTVNVSGLGEVTVLQDPSPLVLSWDCWLPSKPHQGSIEKPLAPQKYIDKIEKWRAAKKPVKFLITGTKINDYFSIESFTYHEEGGDPDTLYYTIKLKSYRVPVVRKLETTPTISIGMARSTGGAGGGPTSVKDGKVKTKGKRLKLYSEASKSSKVLAKMSNKSKLKIKSKSGSWYAVTYVKKNIDGFAQSKYVKVSK